MKKISSVILAVVIALSSLLVGFSFSLSENSIYVSPNGKDDNNGTYLSPLKSFNAAKEKAKKMSGEVTVFFREGTYSFDNTVNFNSADKNKTTYKAYNNEKVVFTAGKELSGFTDCIVNGVNAVYKDVGTEADFNILFNDETTLSRTRYPEKDNLTVKEVSDDDILIESEEETFNHYNGFYVNKKDLFEMKNEKDVIVRVLHYWKDEIVPIEHYDANTGHLKLARATSMRMRKDDRYFFENVFEALDKPGEWYLDRSVGRLYYVPTDGEITSDIVLWASETETMLAVNGADGISFEGITFRANGYNLPSNESIDCSQAAFDATPCIKYVNSKDFHITNCDFKDIASCAIYLGYNVQNAEINSNYFENLGAQAIYVRGENIPIDRPDVTKNISFKNNCVNGYGKFLYNAVAVLVIHANSVNIENNELHDGYYSAISVGWVWGYSYTVTYNNRICNNLIYNIGQGWLSDMGGIYTLGNQPGTVISGNVIHNVAAEKSQGGYGGWGIYLDEGSAYILVENNLVYSCGSDGFHTHYGSYNTVRNNIFALNGESQARVVSNWKRSVANDGGRLTSDFYGNILLTDNKVRVFSAIEDKSCWNNYDNILWDLTYGTDLYISKGTDYQKSVNYQRAVRKGLINNSILINPGFKDAAHFDFTLDENSAAVKSGFNAWNYQAAGTVSDTTVGTSYAGGLTLYNSQARAEDYLSAKEPFHFLFDFINKLINFFTSVFSMSD